MKLLFVVLALVITQACSEKLLVTVFYEALCSDSRNFIQEQLVPSVKKLEECVHFRLIPFGKAKVIYPVSCNVEIKNERVKSNAECHNSTILATLSINKERGWFVCQHGPNECRGNKVQDCALQYMQDRSEVERVDYVNCEMQNMSGSFGNLQCVVDAGIDVRSVEECMTTNLGIDLQLDSEYLTKVDKLEYVPTVTLNDDFNQPIQDASQVDLYRTVCNYLENSDSCC